jgi:protein-S-isoprenylcysteine O-methyltransferase Ste14
MIDLRDRLFSLRSYTPIPFLVAGLFFGAPTIPSLIGGIVVAFIGEAIRFWGVGHASYETRVTGSVGASRLVVTGPFAYVRNPLYVGNILLYTGFAIMANRPWLVLLTAAWFIFQYMMIVSREEEFLAGKFGEEYEAYRRAVPRFFPRTTPYQPGRDGTIAWEVAVRSERRTFQAFGIALLLMVVRFMTLSGSFL